MHALKRRKNKVIFENEMKKMREAKEDDPQIIITPNFLGRKPFLY